MKENLPQKYNESFFYKIKMFFRNLFSSTESKYNDYDNLLDSTTKIKNDSIAELKEQHRKLQLKDDIVAQIDKNPDLMDTLSIERLKELNSIYVEKIKARDMEITKLEKEIVNLKAQNA